MKNYFINQHSREGSRSCVSDGKGFHPLREQVSDHNNVPTALLTSGKGVHDIPGYLLEWLGGLDGPQWCNRSRVASLTLLAFSDVRLDVLFVTRPIEPLFILVVVFQMSNMVMELFQHSLLWVEGMAIWVCSTPFSEILQHRIPSSKRDFFSPGWVDVGVTPLASLSIMAFSFSSPLCAD